MTPQSSANQCYSIRESWLPLGIPRGTSHCFCSHLHQFLCCHSNQRIQPKQCRCSARYRQVIPLPLRFHSKMCAGFFKRHFHRPTPHKPREYLLRGLICIGRKKSLRVELALWVTNQHPADFHCWQPAVIPDGCLCANLYLTTTFSIPVIKLKLRPLPPAIIERLLQRWSPRAFQPRTPLLSSLPLRGRIIERSIQPQARDETCTFKIAHSLEQLNDGETAISHKNHCAIGQPAHHQLNNLPRPFDKCLVSATALLLEPLARTLHRQAGPRPASVGPTDITKQNTTQPTQA